jgi:uncharacterized protein (TIGR01777 family)
MKNILIVGGTGMIGEVLQKLLNAKHYRVGILTRARTSPRVGIKYFLWNPNEKFVDPEAIRFADIIVNLSGENVAGGRWTEKRKKAITQSRLLSNEILIEACANEKKWPEVYLSAGGMNYYGDRGNELLSESSGKGKQGFLPESCALWESAVRQWEVFDVRTAQFRMGIVLSNKDGALPKMAMSIPWGIAPYFGHGKQWVSWIHVQDMAGIFLHSIQNEQIRGVYNAASPDPRTNKEFIKAVLKKMGRKALVLSVPTWALQIILGQMSETVLSSVRLDISNLLSSGFKFKYPSLQKTLDQLFDEK